MRVIKIISLILAFGLLVPSLNAQEQKPELITEQGSSGLARNMTFSPNGELLAVFDEQTVRLWHIGDKKLLRSFPDLRGDLSSRFMTFSPDGKLLVIIEHQKVKIWEVATGELSGVIENVWGNITFSSDGRSIIGVQRTLGQEFVKKWNIDNRKEIQSNVLQTGSVGTMGIGSERVSKKLVAGVGYDVNGSKTSKEIITVYETETGNLLYSFDTGTPEEDDEIYISPDDQFLVSTNGKVINIWNTTTGKKLHTIRVSDDKYIKTDSKLCFGRDGKTLIGQAFVSPTTENIKVWDISSGQELRNIQLPFTGFADLACSQDGEVLAVSYSESYYAGSTRIKFFEPSTGKEINSLKNDKVTVSSISFGRDGKSIISGSKDGTIKNWNTSNNGEPQPLGENFGGLDRLAFDKEKYLMASSLRGYVYLYDIRAGKHICTYGNFLGVDNIALSSDGKLLAIGVGTLINFYDTTNVSETKALDRNSSLSFIRLERLQSAFAMSPDGKLIATASQNENVVRIWDVATGKEIRQLKGHSQQINILAFNSDASVVASSGYDTKIKLWDVANGTELKTLAGQDSVAAFAFSPNGKVLASGGRDKKIKVWSIATGEEIKTLAGHSEAITDLEIDAKSDELLSSGEDGTICLWNIEDGKKLVEIFSGREDWLVTTPEGFFDGTPNAWKQLVWRFNNNTFDYGAVELYFNDFFYPNLLQDVLAGKSPQPKAGQELGKIDRRQPAVEIASIDGQTKNQLDAQAATGKRTVSIVIEVADNAGEKKQSEHNATSGAQDLRLFRNGSLVKIWRGDVFDAAASGCEKIQTEPSAPRRVRCRAEVAIVAGANDFTAYAFNAANVKSNDAAAQIKGGLPKRGGTLYVLAVGVNRYANADYDLNFAVPDVVEIGSAVERAQAKLSLDAELKRYDETKVITLKDETATKENILLALGRFAKDEKGANDSAKPLPENLCAKLPGEICAELKTELGKIKPAMPEDALLIYYAGHGTSRGERFFILPHDFTGAGGEKSLTEQGVSDIELNDSLEKVDAGKLLMAIDACQSGQALGAKDAGRAPMNSKGLAQLAYDKGMYILTAAQSQESALEAVEINGTTINHGLLTYALLEALAAAGAREADKDANNQLSEREWFDYAVGQVPFLQREAMRRRHVEIARGLPEDKKRAEIVYLPGDDKTARPEDRAVQTPRVFYKREIAANPFVVAKP